MLSPDSVKVSCRYVEDFASVHRNHDPVTKTEAVDLLLASLGMTDTMKRDFTTWIESFYPEYSGEIWMGLLVGLFVHRYETE